MRQKSQWVKLFIICCRQLVLQLREIGSNFNYIKKENTIKPFWYYHHDAAVQFKSITKCSK